MGAEDAGINKVYREPLSWATIVGHTVRGANMIAWDMR